VPVDVKFSAPRWNNFRPYLIAGASPTVDLTTRKHAALMMKPFDCYLELGMGCDIYLPFFKLIPELKFCIGLADILKKNRSDLIDNTLEKFTHSLDGAQSKLIVFTLYFE
ncbi:MAG: PorT family protein, partial [Bacteroidaceae bacterium]|nr:PorT family protein [Bacteroidaceae bacterium]